MTNPLTRALAIEICADAHDAIAQGYDYAQQPDIYKPIELTKVVVVRDGTEAGNASVDFILVDGTGQKFVFIITGNLLKTIPC